MSLCTLCFNHLTSRLDVNSPAGTPTTEHPASHTVQKQLTSHPLLLLPQSPWQLGPVPTGTQYSRQATFLKLTFNECSKLSLNIKRD